MKVILPESIRPLDVRAFRLAKWLFRILFIAALCFQTLPAGAMRQAADTVDVSFTSSPFTITGCETVVVQVWAANVTYLYGADIEITYDPALLQAVGPVENGGLLVDPWITANTIDNTAGKVYFSASQHQPAAPVSGSGTLLKVSFRGLKAGAAALHFSSVQLVMVNGSEIGYLPVNPIDGAVTLVQAANQTSLASISPTSIQAGSPAFSLTANGENFISGSTVRWNGADLQTALIGSNQLTATVPAALITDAGVVDVNVSSPGLCGGVTGNLVFSILPGIPVTGGSKMFIPLVQTHEG